MKRPSPFFGRGIRAAKDGAPPAAGKASATQAYEKYLISVYSSEAEEINIQ
ncbi:MAG: hypothetical protein Q8K65_08160 [Alphaproteobacteria bacterium]|nr:hypothetical protein [Alphaproteobacteria bacterium]